MEFSRKSFGILLMLCAVGSVRSENNTRSSDNIELRVGSLRQIQNHFEATIPVERNNQWQFINNGTGLVPIVKSELVLECLSTSPIEWNITGYIKEPEIIKIQPYKRLYSGEDTYFLKVIIFFLEGESGSSSTFTCQRVGKPEDRKYFDVFYPGKTPLVHGDKHVTIVDSSIIPCPTTDPLAPVALYKMSLKGEWEHLEKVGDDHVQYNPMVGFTLPLPAEGTFSCSTAEDSVTIEAKLSQHNVKDGYDFYPKNSSVKTFASEQVLLVCSSSISNVSIRIDDVSEITFLEKLNLTTKRNDKLVNSVVVSSKDGNPLSLSAACVDIESGLMITNWTVELVQPPQLHLDNFEGEVSCLSDYEDKSISTVRCINPSHCDYLKHCFQSPDMCNFKKQKQFHSSYDTTCWVEKLHQGKNCTFVPYYHLNGIAQCKSQGLSRSWMFFSGLDYRRYSDWRDAPKDALIKMELRKNGTAQVVTCKAASFLFADSLRFSYVFTDGTEEFLSSDNIKILGSESDERMEELNVAAKVQDLGIPSKAVGMKCYAPWWNSTEFMSTEISLDGACK